MKETKMQNVENSEMTINMVRGEINIPFLVEVINIVDGEFGKVKIVKVNGRDEPMALPIIKDLKPLEVGRFYLLKQRERVKMTNGYSRIPYTVKECDEHFYNKYSQDYKAMEENIEATMEEIELKESI